MGLAGAADVAGAAQLTGTVSKSRTLLILLINTRENRRDVRQSRDDDGGRALKFYSRSASTFGGSRH